MLQYKTLQIYVEGLCEPYDYYEAEGGKCSLCTENRNEKSRISIQNNRCDEKQNDNIIYIYKEIDGRFRFIDELSNMSANEVRKYTISLINFYLTDLGQRLIEEHLHFQRFLREMKLSSNNISANDFLCTIHERKIT